MPENSPLLIVLLCQVLFISFYVPARVLGVVRYVVEKYPPAQYAKLYPVSIGEMEKAQRIYKVANLLIGLVGLTLVFYGFYSPKTEMLDWDSQSVLVFYFMLQSSPWIVILVNPGFTFFNLARKPDTDRTRVAVLERRRLLDFVSSRLLYLAAATYIAFVLFVIAKPELWGAGYWNILFVSFLNVFFAGVIAFHLYGRKTDPHQSHEDRLRQIHVGVNLAVLGSIGGTLILVINVGLQNYAGGLQDMAISLYLQLVVYSTLWLFRIDDVNFEVYKSSEAANPELRDDPNK